MRWKNLIFPPFWVVAVLTVFTAVAVPWVLLSGFSQSLAACIVYGVAFYAVCVVTAWCVFRFPAAWKAVHRHLDSHPWGHRYFTDPVFKTWVQLWRSLAVSLVFVAVHGITWYLSGSAWYAILTVYYAILALLRFLLLGPVKDDSYPRQRRRSKICGGILLLVNFTLSAAVLMILYQGKGYDYQGMLIYVMALYTFYATIRAIVDMVRYRKLGSPAIHAAKVVSLCAALVSMLNLETAMFAQFGTDMAPKDQYWMIALTGGGVSIAIIALSLWLLRKK